MTSPKPARTVSIVIPCYNEESVLPILFGELDKLAETISERGYATEFVFVDDGSRDDTLTILLARSHARENVRIVEFSRNFGKESAMSAGLDFATGDAVVPIDADLQDPPELIFEMIERWENGAQVVIAKRIERDTDTFMKRQSALGFYRLHNAIANVKIPENVGDFRLMDRAVVDAIKQLPERARFMKGLFAWVGFRTETIEYARPARASGETKFSGIRLWNFALEGLTSFSTVPLKIWTYVGMAGALFGMSFLFYTFFKALFLGSEVSGYSSLLVTILFFGSLNLISVGFLGEYIGRIYAEVKQRPLYVVNQLHTGKTGGDAEDR